MVRRSRLGGGRRDTPALMKNLLFRFVRGQGGDDLIEYALLASLAGVAGAAALAAFPGIMNAVYTAWDTDTQDIWEPLDPQ